MGMLVAQVFERMRREIDDDQPPPGRSTRAAPQCAAAGLGVMQHLMDDAASNVPSASGSWFMSPSRTMQFDETGPLEVDARDREHLARLVDAERVATPGPSSSSIRPVPVPMSSMSRGANAPTISASTASTSRLIDIERSDLGASPPHCRGNTRRPIPRAGV